jgi:hypothetical protein
MSEKSTALTRSPLLPDRHPIQDFFICDVTDAIPKDDVGSMEHPIFSLSPPTPLDLVGASFERVHEAARTEHLSDRAWFVVEPFVPELSWFSNWDKCERLRRGLVSAFVRYRWSASELKLRIKDDQLLWDIGRSAKRIDGGDQLAQQGLSYR